MESRYLDRANPSKKRGKQYAAFVCSNAFYGPNGLPTRFHFKFWKDSNKDADGAISSNVSMGKVHGISTVVSSEYFRKEDIRKT